MNYVSDWGKWGKKINNDNWRTSWPAIFQPFTVVMLKNEHSVYL